MKYLLDTHTYLWFLLDNPKLSNNAKTVIENLENEIYLSSVVVWEISIKLKIGKIELAVDLDTFIANSIQEYNFVPQPMTIPHAIQVYNLPDIHQDPFDRMLIAQAQVESLDIITSDIFIREYEVDIIW